MLATWPADKRGSIVLLLHFLFFFAERRFPPQRMATYLLDSIAVENGEVAPDPPARTRIGTIPHPDQVTRLFVLPGSRIALT